MRPDRPSLTVVVPALNEAERLPLLLHDLSGLGAAIIVVDGGSSDGTPRIARSLGARVLSVAPGRGAQLRAGAAAADSDWIFFVHADCRIGPDALDALRSFLGTAPDDDFAHFRFALEGRGRMHRLIELGQRLRERALGLVYGDQGLVVSRTLYDRASGFPDWPLMEDVGMIDRLSLRARRVALPAPLLTSARRYEQEGPWRRWLRNVALITLFRLGVSPERLARRYRARRGTRDDLATSASPGGRGGGRHDVSGEATDRMARGRRRRIVGVFAKEPVPGRVKTRLAADLGDERAAEVYRALGRSTVDGLRGGAYRLIVFADPPEAATGGALAGWLGAEGVEYRPQSGGDLGRRMAAALDECLAEADAACLVGTDIPGIDEETAEAAFRALSEHDVVLGPATDGGYYLVGLSRPLPELFENVPWSTGLVLSETLARAGRIGVGVALLDTRTDVDTLADVPPQLLSGDNAPRAPSPSPAASARRREDAGPRRGEDSPP